MRVYVSALNKGLINKDNETYDIYMSADMKQTRIMCAKLLNCVLT